MFIGTPPVFLSLSIDPPSPEPWVCFVDEARKKPAPIVVPITCFAQATIFLVLLMP
jgi:hypothetical protein